MGLFGLELGLLAWLRRDLFELDAFFHQAELRHLEIVTDWKSV